MKNVYCAITLFGVLLLPACPGDGIPVVRPDRGVDRGSVKRDVGTVRLDKGPLTADVGAKDGTPSGDVSPGICSAAGTKTACDPVGGTGCSAGACYLVGAKGFSCVCPVGQKPVGAVCQTTSECAPGFGCAGDVAPGNCRRFCSAANDTCGANETCKAITTFLKTGFCVPKP